MIADVNSIAMIVNAGWLLSNQRNPDVAFMNRRISEIQEAVRTLKSQVMAGVEKEARVSPKYVTPEEGEIVGCGILRGVRFKQVYRNGHVVEEPWDE